MKLKMIENAIDSLEITRESFDLWTRCKNEEESRYLKLTITFLHNAIELLVKALLLKKDETIIYDKNMSAQILSEAREESKKKNISLYNR